VHEDVAAGTVTEPFLVAGFPRRWLHLAHHGSTPATVSLEIDRHGDDRWTHAQTVEIPPGSHNALPIRTTAPWVRLRTHTPLTSATAWFHLSRPDGRARTAHRTFKGLASPDTHAGSDGVVLARAGNHRTLAFAAITRTAEGTSSEGYYELDASLRLRRIDGSTNHAFVRAHAAIPAGTVETDAASAVFVDDSGRRWRLPVGDARLAGDGSSGPRRVDREVATERDLFNTHGTFYELPAENAGGFARIRPVATHNRRIHDYCSWRGLLVLSGLAADAPSDNPNVLRSDDGRAALWAGALDDLWKMGKPRGVGGPWKDTVATPEQPSDPYLMNGFDRKSVTLSHQLPTAVDITLELEVAADGRWHAYRTFTVPPGRTITHRFPPGLGAYWIRARTSQPGSMTVQLTYN
jgi:hypothetical protein